MLEGTHRLFIVAMISVVFMLITPTVAIGMTVNVAKNAVFHVPGQLRAVACPNVSFCLAVGSEKNQGMVVPINDGVPGSARSVSDVFGFGAVACPSNNICEATGQSKSGGSAVVTINSGIPGLESKIPALAPWSIACPSQTTCLVAGEGPPGVLVTITNGIVGAVQTEPGTFTLTGVACTTRTTCLTVSTALSNGEGLFIPITNGKLGIPRTVPGIPFLLSLACPTSQKCVSIGLTPPPHNQGYVVLFRHGRSEPPRRISATSGVACLRGNTCVAVQEATLVPIVNGVPRAALVVPGTGLLVAAACPTPITCEVVGGPEITTVRITGTP